MGSCLYAYLFALHGAEKIILCFFHLARMMKISLLFMMLLDMESATLQLE